MRVLACLLIVFSPTLFAALTSQHGTGQTSPPPAQVQSAPVPDVATPKAPSLHKPQTTVEDQGPTTPNFNPQRVGKE